MAKTCSVRQDVAALLAGEAVEGAVVALGDADVGVVDDAHDHVGAGVGRVEAAADLGGEVAEFGVGGVVPEPEGLSRGDSLTGRNLRPDLMLYGDVDLSALDLSVPVA